MEVTITKTFTSNSGKLYQAGEVVHCPTSVGEGWIFDKVAERVKYKSYVERLRAEEAAKPEVFATVKWVVAQGAVSGRYYISAACSCANCTTVTYDGSPSAALELVFTHSCSASGFAEKIPASIVAQYRRLHKPVTKYGNDEALAFHLGAPQKSEPVDLYTAKVVNGVRQPPIAGPQNGEPIVSGVEAGLSPLLFLPAQEEHVDKTTFGPQGKQPLVPSDEVLHPLPFKI
jgi:hypothetical protein